jgi:hypothetical protein
MILGAIMRDWDLRLLDLELTCIQGGCSTISLRIFCLHYWSGCWKPSPTSCGLPDHMYVAKWIYIVFLNCVVYNTN